MPSRIRLALHVSDAFAALSHHVAAEPLANLKILDADRLQGPNRRRSEHSAFPPVVDQRLLFAGPRLEHVDLKAGGRQLSFHRMRQRESHACTSTCMQGSRVAVRLLPCRTSALARPFSRTLPSAEGVNSSSRGSSSSTVASAAPAWGAGPVLRVFRACICSRNATMLHVHMGS